MASSSSGYVDFPDHKLLKGRVYNYLANFISLATVDAGQILFHGNDEDDKLMLLKVSTNQSIQ